MLFLVDSTPIKSLEVLEVLRKFKQWLIDQIGCTLSNNGHLKEETCFIMVKNSSWEKSKNILQSLILEVQTLEYLKKHSTS